jgi:hypothetical protein
MELATPRASPPPEPQAVPRLWHRGGAAAGGAQPAGACAAAQRRGDVHDNNDESGSASDGGGGTERSCSSVRCRVLPVCGAGLDVQHACACAGMHAQHMQDAA